MQGPRLRGGAIRPIQSLTKILQPKQNVYTNILIKIMEQLKTGLWYRSTQSKTNSIYFLEKTLPTPNNPHFSYGINMIGEWSELMHRSFPEFQPAEEWVVSDALRKEAYKRYKGKKIQCLRGGSFPFKFTGVDMDFYFKDNDMWSDGALIYRNGKWARVLEEGEIIQETHYEIY